MPRLLRPFLAFLVVLSIVVVGSEPVAAQQDEPVVVTIDGRGFGHGRGMSQWGAQGYALGIDGQARSYEWILDRYYPNTTMASLPVPLRYGVDADNLRVEIRSYGGQFSGNAQQGDALWLQLASGVVRVSDVGGSGLGIPDIPAGMAARVVSAGDGLELRVKPGCRGSWADDQPELVVYSLPGVKTLEFTPVTATPGIAGLLEICHDDGSSGWFEGRLRGVNVAGSTRTVNVVSIEEYLLSVVRREVFPTWEPAALQAQAVAARSYALSGDSCYGAGSFADTCDTTTCQVYAGLHYRQPGSSKVVVSTAESTSNAVAATAGQVRVFANGSVARTEFSASSGGYTVDAEALGGFPAVEDLGDAVNPSQTWQVTRDLTSWVSLQEKGDLLAIDEVERTGNGVDGGHVKWVDFVFENGTVSMKGEDARRVFSLRSSWFTFDDSTLLAANDAYVDAVYVLFLQRQPAASERSSTATALRRGSSRFSVTSALSLSPEWAGVEIDDLYPIVFSRDADAEGRAFWLDQMIRGRRLQSVAAEFYGSPEFFVKVGSSNRAFVEALYTEVQGRAADADGLRFWSDQLDTGRMNRSQVAAGFYASPESREQQRVRDLYQQVLGRAPDAGGLAHWAQQLLTRDDVALAAELAASDEYFQRSQR